MRRVSPENVVPPLPRRLRARGIRRFGYSERRQCRRSPGRLLIENKHFVAFRTWHPRFLSAVRLVACALGWNLPAAQRSSPAPPGASAGRSPRRWPSAGRRWSLSGRKAEALEALAAELPGEGHRVLPADLAEPGAAEKLAAEAGEVDVLVANAGLPGAGLARPTSRAEQVTRALRVNLEAPMLLARALEPGDARARARATWSSSPRSRARSPTPRTSIYNATKFGLRGFALGLRADLDPQGIGVSLVSPGFDPRSRDVRRLRRQADPRAGHRHARAGRRRRGQGDRARTRSRSRWRRSQQRLLAHFALASPGDRGPGRRAAHAGQKAARGGRRRPSRRASADSRASARPPLRRMESMSSRLLRRPFDPRGGRALLRGLPARRAAGALRRRAPALLGQGAAGERAAARGRASR